MTAKELMKSGKLYDATVSDLIDEQMLCLDKIHEYNMIKPSDMQARTDKLKEIFAEMGKECYIETPFHANWGINTHLGDYVYANFNLTLVDDADIYIGSNVMLEPNVTLATAGHPILPELREKGYQFNMPVHIGNNVWIGAGCVVLPGITIGENSVIGAGSVVTKDIPANCVAFGSPCKVIREISEHDREYYFKDLKIDTKF